MIPFIRPATPEEAEQIKDHVDLNGSSVWTWPNPKGQADLAVVKQPQFGIDKTFFGEGSTTQRKTLFLWSLINMLRATGLNVVNFSVDAEGDEELIDLLKGMGAEQVTPNPQFQFKVTL